MSDELAARLLANLPLIHTEPAEFGKASQRNAIETQLVRLSALSMDVETEALREILQRLHVPAPARLNSPLDNPTGRSEQDSSFDGTAEPYGTQKRGFNVVDRRRFFAKGRAPAVTEKEASDMGQTRIGRNDPCPCGSGKKYKKCCGEGA
jgi:preprotein translocase subunit SecA